MTLNPEQISEYRSAIQFLDSLANIERDEYMRNLRVEKQDKHIFLARTQKLLDLLDNPEKKLQFIHVAGTSGKGSTTRMIQTILTTAGKKTGCFTSPFISCPIEKIPVGEQHIDPVAITTLIWQIRDTLNLWLEEGIQGGLPSHFEIWLALALKHFANEGCEYVVLETGAGGEFDASNVIPHKELALITSISFDHTDLLGDTIEEIAQAKAGIISPGSTVLVGKVNEKAAEVIKKIATENKAASIQFFSDTEGESTQTPGRTSNEWLATQTAKHLGINSTYIEAGIRATQLPATLETVQQNPRVILDGAHNPEKMKELLAFIKKLTAKQVYFIVGFKSGKDVQTMVHQIAPHADHITITRFLETAFKSADTAEIADALTRENATFSIDLDPHHALEIALSKASPEDTIMVTGSLYLVGELRKRWYSEERILANRSAF